MTLKAAALVAFALVAAGAAEALPPAKTMYTDALAREQTLRAALSAPDASPGVLEEVRAEIAAYEAIVRGYPASGYSDNALWQAGCLALDAFARFGQAIDRDAGIRLLRRLAAGYPASSLVAQVPAQLARVNARDAAAPRPQPAKPPAERSPARAPGSLVTIRDIHRTDLPDAVRITIELDGEVPFHDERIADPPRVFVDLPAEGDVGIEKCGAKPPQHVRHQRICQIELEVDEEREEHSKRVKAQTDDEPRSGMRPRLGGIGGEP